MIIEVELARSVAIEAFYGLGSVVEWQTMNRESGLPVKACAPLPPNTKRPVLIETKAHLTFKVFASYNQPSTELSSQIILTWVKLAFRIPSAEGN